MAEHSEGDSFSLPKKKRRIHVGLVECTSYSRSQEGSATLRQPVNRNAPNREPHQGLQPRPSRRRNTKFQAPRKVGERADNLQSISSVSGTDSQSLSQSQNTTGDLQYSHNESQHKNGQADCDEFDFDGDDSEMVAQSSDKSIELLTALGGFTSAAAMHRQPANASWTDSNQFSSSRNTGKNFVQTNYYSSSQNSTGQKRKSGKQWGKDANQRSITQFMKSSAAGSDTVGDMNHNTGPSIRGQQACLITPRSQSSSQANTINSNDRVTYGTPSKTKMYSPLKKVSDCVYVISDEDSPRSSQEKGSAQKRVPPVPSTCSFVKKRFEGQKAVNKTANNSAQKGHSNSKTRSATNKSRSSSRIGKNSVKKQRTISSIGSGQNSTSDSSMRLDDINFNYSDDDFQPSSSATGVSSETPAVKREVRVGKTFGLLGDSKVKVILVNYFERLPPDVMENIFCRLPMMDLCLNMNLVCTSWNDIISNEKFIPWKKLYHHVKLDRADAKRTVEEIIQAEGMTRSSLRLLNLISYMQSFKRVSKENNVCELLQQHPKYTWAVALLKERAPQCFIEQEPNPWSVLCALVLLAASVEDISFCLHLLTSARSHLLSAEVLECLYCIATFLLAFKMRGQTRINAVQQVHEGLHRIPIMEAKRSSMVCSIHYRLFYALYLFENASVSNHSMLQEAKAGHAGQQSIVKYSQGETEVRLTHEQMRIIKYTPDQATGEVVKIFAFAGTGKTTTLVRYAQMRPNLKFLLLVFNKSVCEHAKSKFPPNVTCKTGHGLAFSYTGRKYAAEKQLNGGNMRVFEIVMGLPERPEGQKENMYVRAKLVMNTLKNFMASADEHITTQHTPQFIINDDGMREPIEHNKRMLYAEDAEHYWHRMTNLHDRFVKMTHDGYLKLFQLSKPKLWGYDIIMVDEAQDLTPALLDVVQKQRQPKVFVGDQHQQIYAFRGAVNAMSGVQASRVFYLTQSFRFGPEVSHVANIMLEILKGERRKTLVGHGIPGKMNGEQVGQLTILCRTNFTLFAEAVKLCVYSDQPIKISIVGGMDSFGFPMLEDIYTLMMAPADRVKEKRDIQSKFIARFENIGELEKYAKKTADVELLGKIRIVQSYHHNLPQCINKIRQKSIRDTTQADVLLSTVHKAKGLEFSTVKVTDDFLDLQQFLESGILHTGMIPLAIPVEEANLMYVAVTRAKHALIMSESIFALLTQIGGGGMHPVLSEKLKKDGVSFVCEETKTEFQPQALTIQKQEITLGNKRVVRSCVYSPVSLVGNGSEYAHLMGDREEQKRQEKERQPVVVLVPI